MTRLHFAKRGRNVWEPVCSVLAHGIWNYFQLEWCYVVMFNASVVRGLHRGLFFQLWMLWNCHTTAHFFWLCVQVMLRLGGQQSSEMEKVKDDLRQKVCWSNKIICAIRRGLFPQLIGGCNNSQCAVWHLSLQGIWRDFKWISPPVSGVTVSLNIRDDSVVETLPPSRGNGEKSWNKQLECPVHIHVLHLTAGSHIEISEWILCYATS